VTVAVVSPGAMGSAVGAALVRGGARVVATLAERSERTARLAARAELELLPDLTSVVREADVVLSIVPPEFATEVAAHVVRAAAATETLLVDLNAIAPTTARGIAEGAAASGHEVVDGSISGPPPWRSATTRIYLSGGRAEEVAELPFDGVDLIVVGDGIGSASAVKMSTASVYKGSTAVLMQALVAAHANGVLQHVLSDLGAGSPELVRDVERRLASATAKSGRYVGEMREIASTQAVAGLTPSLFEAMAEIYATTARTPLATTAPEDISSELKLVEILDALRPEKPPAS
jgi:3-hydroxyisobutyrate dehydrogenase-like beta-hydroxyacid dehydrogenase